jgi:hypothetical protein
MRRLRLAVVTVVIAATLVLNLSGCNLQQQGFVQQLRATVGVAEVTSTGGLKTDTDWEVLVTPDSDLTDAEIATLAENLAAQSAAWHEGLPGSFLLHAGRFDLAIADSVPEMRTRLERWQTWRDEPRITAGYIEFWDEVVAAPTDVFDLITDLTSNFSDLQSLIVVTDARGFRVNPTISLSADPQCDNPAANFAAFESATRVPFETGMFSLLRWDSCNNSKAEAVSKDAVLAIADATLSATTDPSLDMYMLIEFSLVDSVADRGRYWSVDMTQMTAKRLAALRAVYALPTVASCEFAFDGVLWLRLQPGESEQTVTELVKASGAEFTSISFSD